MDFLKKIDKGICIGEEFIAAVCLLAMCIIVFLAVVLRFAGIPFSVSDELSRYLMIWCIYIGIIVATRERAHVGVEVLVAMLPEAAQKILKIIASVITLLTLCWMFYLTAMWVSSTMQGNIQLTPLMKIPYYTVYMSLPLGFGLSIIEQVKNTITDIIAGNKEGGQ